MILCKASKSLRVHLGLLTSALVAAAGLAYAAETMDPAPTAKTLLVLKVAAGKPIAVHSLFQAQPPTLTLTFPGEQVIGSIPERASISKGVIRTVVAQYASQGLSQGPRLIRSVQISLSGPYPPQVRSEPGRVIVEIEHPAAVGGAAYEIGVKGGTIIEGLTGRHVSDRFRAMQEAMARMTPTPWSLQITSAIPDSPVRAASAAGERERAPTGPPARTTRANGSAFGWIVAGLLLAAAAAWLWASRIRRRSVPGPQPSRAPSAVLLIDELVWKTFERQGHHIVQELDLAPPLGGPLRVLVKDGVKSALLFVGNGPFFEKQTVERFVQAMQDAQVEQGTLVASGSFTVPAQRAAKDRGVTLIGRDELIGVLGAVAGMEYVAKQIEQQQARLVEAAESLRQYAAELGTLRRQRNEATWQLGEERAKSARLEADLQELRGKLQDHDSELNRWERDLTALRKQWEESQWYLGEARSRARHLEAQIAILQERAKQTETAEMAREAAVRALEEARTSSRTLDTALAETQDTVEALGSRERALQESLDRLTQELSALRAFGERRSTARRRIPGILVELRNGRKTPLFVGPVRDLSLSGFGLDTDRQLPELASFRARVTLPGSERFESSAKLTWQRSDSGSGYQSGYRLVNSAPAFRARLEQLIEEPSS